jgi:hypothetical protein
MVDINLNYQPRKWQVECHKDRTRFRVLALHRRAGKSTLGTMELIDAAIKTKLEMPLYAYVSPFLSQSKAIAWGMIKFRLKELIQRGAVHVNEAELTITFQHNDAKIKLFGGDNYDALRGVRLDGVIIDEIAQIKPELWQDVVQPALSDRKGFCLFIGTPSGVNLFSELFFKAKDLPDWSSKLFTVYDTDAIDAAEVERLRRDMSEASFKREYLCDFAAAGEDQLISLGDIEESAQRVYKYGEFTYAPKIIGVDPARFGDDCFDSLTEILTNEGWKLFSNLSGKEKVMSIPKDGECASWEKIDKIHCYDFDGEMNLHETSSANFCITDKHRLLVRTNPKSRLHKFESYKNLAKNFVMRDTNSWSGSNPETIKFQFVRNQPHGGVMKKEWQFNFMDWAAFLGWFVSEGNVYQEKRFQGRKRILITQNPGVKQDKIKSLLNAMGINYRITPNQKQLEFTNEIIGRHLQDECGIESMNKKIPQYMKDASPQAIQAFLDTFLLGDGTCRKDGSGKTYITSSKQLADDIQEMLAKLGKAGALQLKEKAGSIFIIGDRKVIRQHDTYLIYEREKAQGKWIHKGDVQRVKYTGKIWCVSTKHQSVYVRRKGISMWSGNSSVIIKRQGFTMFDPIAFQGIDNMGLADQVAYHISTWKPDAVFIDAGNGSGIIDRLRQLGHSVIEVPFGGKSSNPTKYANKRAEIWDACKQWINEGGSIPNHMRLKQDLATPCYWFDSANRMILEKKEDIKSRGLPSTDYGDAACLTFAAPVVKQKDIGGQDRDAGYKSGYDPFDRKHMMQDIGKREAHKYK